MNEKIFKHSQYFDIDYLIKQLKKHKLYDDFTFRKLDNNGKEIRFINGIDLLKIIQNSEL